MPNKPFDDNKHPRDTGKFSRIPGGKGDGPDAAEPPAPDPRDDARQEIKNTLTGAPGARHPQQLRTLGLTSGRAYEAATNATKALHASGDVSVLHHHGKAMQDAVKALKRDGAKPEELEKLRRGLTALHSALSIGDQVAAHEAVTGLQHGFYHAYSSFRKENGPGSFPLIGQEFKDAVAAGDARTKKILSEHPNPETVAASQHSYKADQADRKARDYMRGYRAAMAKFSDGPQSASAKHRKVLESHGYEFGYHHNGKNVYTHPSGHTAHTNHEGTEIYHKGKKLNTLSTSEDLHGYLTDTHGPSKHDAVDPDKPINKLETMRAAPASPVTFHLHTAPVHNGDPDGVTKFKDAVVEALKATPPTPVHITVPQQQTVVENKVSVEPTPVKFEATVQAAPAQPSDVHVHVSPTPVHVDNKVNVEAKPGEMKVTADVKIPERKPRDLEFKTDKDGKIIGAKER